MKDKLDEIAEDKTQLNMTIDDLLNITQAQASTAHRQPDSQVDSACTHHMRHDRDDFDTYTPATQGRNVLLADGTRVPVAGSGTINMSWMDTHGIQRNIRVKALHVPTFTNNLFSVPQATSDGHVFDIHRAINVFTIDPTVVKPIAAFMACHTPPPLWHTRLGHARPTDFFCEACAKTKLSKHPQSRIAIPKAPGPRGERYFFNFVDTATGMTFVETARNKSERDTILKDIANIFANHKWKGSYTPIRTLFTHDHPGDTSSERDSRTQHQDTKHLWPQAVKHAAYILNRLPRKANPGNKPPVVLALLGVGTNARIS